jgi:hypothetical protein
MKKTTLYLPDDLKTKLEKAAKQQKLSEATVIRDAIATAVGDVEIPKPRPLAGVKLSEQNVAERVDELMEGYGER